ncbi:MAG: peroxidase-related enzyme, partial [Candidatus Eiseniibacteriota bacterium]
MSWIRSVGVEQAGGELRPVYESIRAASNSGRVSNLWQSCGLDPRGLQSMFAHYRSLMSDPEPLSASQAEFIALAVSAVNGCGYCVAHHGPRAARACGDESLARAVARDYRQADLAARDRVILDAAIALTCEPSERKPEDIER